MCTLPNNSYKTQIKEIVNQHLFKYDDTSFDNNCVLTIWGGANEQRGGFLRLSYSAFSMFLCPTLLDNL